MRDSCRSFAERALAILEPSRADRARAVGGIVPRWGVGVEIEAEAIVECPSPA